MTRAMPMYYINRESHKLEQQKLLNQSYKAQITRLVLFMTLGLDIHTTHTHAYICIHIKVISRNQTFASHKLACETAKIVRICKLAKSRD